jgi:hypothetical protein
MRVNAHGVTDMKIRLIHPLWTHLPVLGLIIYLAIQLVMAGPLPSEAPTHFGFNGLPDAYGSPWISFGLIFSLALLFGILTVIFDEIWARNEKGKSFNWASLLDELTAGALVGISLGYLRMLESGENIFKFPVGDLWMTAGIALGLAAVLELVRPFRPNPLAFVAEDTSGLEKELKQRLLDNHAFVFWQSQNPPWVRIITIALPLLMLTLAVVMWFNQPWFSLLYLVIAFGFSMLTGGLRTVVTPERIVVRLGLFNLRVLGIKTAEIASAEIMEFSPIKDFGGYGIRFNGKMYAYYLQGNRGIKITLQHGMKYLIGTDHPEQLLAVINAVSIKKG